MNLNPGYSLKIIKENLAVLKEIVDEGTALSVALSYARHSFKQERPDTTAFPEHLRPGQARAALEVEDGK